MMLHDDHNSARIAFSQEETRRKADPIAQLIPRQLSGIFSPASLKRCCSVPEDEEYRQRFFSQ
jgi:hypothetical protein